MGALVSERRAADHLRIGSPIGLGRLTDAEASLFFSRSDLFQAVPGDVRICWSRLGVASVPAFEGFQHARPGAGENLVRYAVQKLPRFVESARLALPAG